ncbi:MAG: efflux RND transporter periplasmic adaptor subunit [Candidatus Eisenbacteria bacterium]
MKHFIVRWGGGVCAVLALALLLGGMIGLFAGCERHATAGKYYCPMHPTYVSDRPGDCPICNMRLVPVPAGGTGATGGSGMTPGSAAPSDTTHHAGEMYSCPMHPEVTSDKPDRCPKCGMDLVRTAPKAKDQGAMPDMAPLDLTAEEIELAGVRTAPAVRGALGAEVRAVGTVVPNERMVRTVNAKVGGYVERLLVSTSGQAISAGQPVLELYSPDLLAAQEEFVHALTAVDRSAPELPEARESAERLRDAARRRLELLDVSAAAIAALERDRRPDRTVTLYSPYAGFVLAKSITQGAGFEAGAPLYTVVDLSSVWVEASFHEREARLLRVGRSARIASAYDPGVTRSADVVLVSPELDPVTRTLTARFELSNPDLKLKPGMFAEVSLASESTSALLVPTDAVLDSGRRQVVFVQVADRRFEPRQVVLGQRSGEMAEIVSGLAEGDRVVARAAFLLDSESRIRAAVSTTTADLEPAMPGMGH